MSGITARAVIIGLVCGVFLCLVTPYNDYYVGGTFLAGNHFPIGPVFILIILTLLVNVGLKKAKHSFVLTPFELVIIWSMTVAVSGLPSSGMMRYLIPALVSWKHFATPENDWANLLHQYIPKWLVVTDSKAVESFFEGIQPGESIPWRAWLKPLLIWTLFLAILYFVIFCLSMMLRKQWIEREKLTFPLVQLPLEIIKKPNGASLINSFFKNRIMWAGFAFPVILHTFNGLHSYFPAVPRFSTYFFLDPFLVNKPWNAMRPFPMHIFLSVIGFSYLLNLDVSFSLWFFFLFCRFQYLLAEIFGLRLHTAFGGFSFFARSFTASQEMGAGLIFVAFVIWNTRDHIKNTLRRIVSDGSNKGQENLWAVIGFIIGITALIFIHKLAGMSLIVSSVIVIITFAEYIVLTWLVVHGGMLLVNPSWGPNNLLITTIGSARLGQSNIAVIFLRPRSLRADLREFMMPNVMNGLKMSDSVRLKRSHLLISMGIAILFGLVVSYYSYISLAYKYGASNMGYVGWSGFGSLREMSSLILNPSKTNWTDTIFIALGGIMMSFLMLMRRRFLWWPFHPIGYATLSSWATLQLWFSILIGWFFNFTILKFGGLRIYRKARPAFLGLVLGESFMAVVWVIVGLFTGTGYRILSG
ncbi:MAG: hypothetical protein JRF50_16870 [Deltaproteobacteria bacterium]|nr:hypothetical protein [Deltaproteobacteria bacterium]